MAIESWFAFVVASLVLFVISGPTTLAVIRTQLHTVVALIFLLSVPLRSVIPPRCLPRSLA